MAASAVAVVGAVALMAAPPATPRWQEIGVATDGTRAFVEASSLTGAAERISARQLFLLPRPNVRGANWVEQQVIYDCAARRVQTIGQVEYDGDGRVIARERPGNLEHYGIPAGTLPEYILDAIC